uniref:Putative secreted protein n=1 Tax=Ixodes ricinus TaxID=34613 RepID=A0A6B0UQE9_IXORI
MSRPSVAVVAAFQLLPAGASAERPAGERPAVEQASATPTTATATPPGSWPGEKSRDHFLRRGKWTSRRRPPRTVTQLLLQAWKHGKDAGFFFWHAARRSLFEHSWEGPLLAETRQPPPTDLTSW